METNGVFSQKTPQPDGQIFIAVAGSAASAGVINSTLGLTGLTGMQIPASTNNGQILTQLENLLLRTGILQSTNLATNLSQQAFGTANGPGPSTVAGTSGPSGFGASSSIPPITKANLPTLIGSVAGAIKKGIQINWVDYIYQTLGGAATSIQASLTAYNAPAPGNDLTLTSTAIAGPSNLDTTANSANTKVHRVRVTPTTPFMMVTDATMISSIFLATTPAGVTVTLSGLLLGVSFNFN